MSQEDLQLVQKATSGDKRALRQLVKRLTPVIQACVNGVLIRFGRARREEVCDHVQEVFRHLLEQEGRVLCAWSPDRGRGLDGYVRMVTERYVISYFRSGRRSGYAEQATEPSHFDSQADASRAEQAVDGRHTLERLLDHLRATLTPEAYELFWMLYVEERDVDEVCALRKVKRQAIYSWRNRFKETVRQWTEQNGGAPS